LFFFHYLNYFTIICRRSNLDWDVDSLIFIYYWLSLNSKYKIFDMFAYLIEFFFILNLVQTELFSFTLSFLYNQLLSDFFVLRTRIEFFNRGDWDTAIVFKTTYFLFLLNAAILIINERVINIIEVHLSIPFFALFDYFAWSIYVALFDYFFIKIISY